MRAEVRLAELFGYRHVVLFGRARAGLVAVLESVAGPGAPLVMPSNLCPAVLAAAVAAGVRPRLAPVSPASGLAEDDRLCAAMAAAGGAGVVMPTHLYGLLAEYPETRRTAARDGWFVLENDTLCAAAVADGRRRAFGDALLVSFNHVKTIEAGFGGAVLTDDDRLAADLAARAARWPVLAPADEAVEADLTLARRHLRALGRGAIGEQLLDIDAAHCRHAFPESRRPALDAALEAFPAAIQARRRRVEWWGQALAGLDGLAAVPVPLSMPWRLVLCAASPALRDRLVVALRQAGFDAGTNFPPLAADFPALLAGQGHRDADEWGRRVINLWLTEAYDASRINAAARVMAACLDEDDP
ncbi:MAG: DegT/DnrJ/EryC1/StrS family aminotransferase [Actinomycetota bacterium]